MTHPPDRPVNAANLIARCIAGVITTLALTVLLGWIADLPVLRSILPGAVEMKINTAVALLLAAAALAAPINHESRRMPPLALCACVLVCLIGIVTLLEYIFGWQAGVDQLLMKDSGHAYNALRGRMSPYSAVAFITAGTALALCGWRSMRPVVLFGAITTAGIGLISALGYFWRANELTTDQWLPPVAIHTGVAFVLLGIGILLPPPVPRTLRANPVGRVEKKVLIGFTLAFALLCIGGGITYRMQANFSNSADTLAADLQIRTALDGLYTAILNAESAQRNYLLTGTPEYRAEFLNIRNQVPEQLQVLKASEANASFERRAAYDHLIDLVQRRLGLLGRHLEIYDRQGEPAMREAIADDPGVPYMRAIRAGVAAMNANESRLATIRESELTRNRSYTLIAMVATLMIATITLLILFGSIVRDIRARAAITRALTTAQREAQDANRAKSQFLAAMSHEIRTPMNGIIGMAELLQQSSLLDSQQQMVNLICESADSLLIIINDILDFSKAEAGRLEIEVVPFSIRDVIEGTAKLLNRMAERGNITFTVFCDPRIPPQVRGDGKRLRQVLINLTNNAIKFSGGLDRRGRVSVRAELESVTTNGVSVRIRVMDNGIGMDQHTQSRLFRSFMQADASTTRRYGGTGLGLAISRQLVDLMGGTIVVASEPGLGSTFTIQLPFSTVELEYAAGLDQPAPLAGLPCLVISGGAGLADDLATYLESEGAAVARSSDLGDACRWTQSRPQGLTVWVVETHGEDPSVTDLLADIRARCTTNVSAVFVVLGRALRSPTVETDGLVMIDGNALHRDVLVGAVSVAAGIRTPEPQTSQLKTHLYRPVPVTREDAIRHGRLILVAEDNEINQRLVREQLSLLDYAADVVGDGKQAFEKWQTGNYALIFADLHMPKMDGYQLALAIRRAEAGKAHIPIIALTANALQGERERCLSVGMDDYLSKPASLATLSATAERWVTGRTIDRTLEPRTGTPPTNIRVLEALVGADPEVIASFLQEFSRSAMQLGEEISSAGARGDCRAAAATAHKLKSSARSVGAQRLGDLCARIESAGTALDVAALRSTLADFAAELHAVREDLRSQLPPHAAANHCA